jgi:hypothetical protein
MGVFRNSFADKHLRAFARRIGGSASTDFYGFTLGPSRVLYRHGYAYYQPRRGKRYARWNWKLPFGREADWRVVDFVLLYGPKIAQADEAVFLFTVSEARRLARAWPSQLNMSPEPERMSGGRDRIWERNKVTLAEARRRIEK